MNQKIAVALIHGVGNQGPEFADTMTSELYEAFAALLPTDDKSVHDKITIRPVYWADILARKERILWNILKHENGLALNTLRNFMMNFVGDATAFSSAKVPTITWALAMAAASRLLLKPASMPSRISFCRRWP